jgi:hypothetical protein
LIFDESKLTENLPVKKTDVRIQLCTNKEADDIFMQHYWMKRVRRSRRLSYQVFHRTEKVAWIQIADPFGTKLTKSLQLFDIQDALELCRGYFFDHAPAYIESCAIGKILRQLPNDWYNTFGVVKKLAIVYQDIDAKQRGVVYRALGFKSYGDCVRARHYTAPTRGSSSGHKIVWAKGLKPVSGRHYKIAMPKLDYDPSLGVNTEDILVSDFIKPHATSVETEMIFK